MLQGLLCPRGGLHISCSNNQHTDIQIWANWYAEGLSKTGQTSNQYLKSRQTHHLSVSVTISRQPHTGTEQTLEHPNFWSLLLTGESPHWQSFNMPQLKKDQ